MKTNAVPKYKESFKLEAVELAKSINNFSEVARRKKIHVNTLRKWIKEFEENTSATNFENIQKSSSSLDTDKFHHTPDISKKEIDEDVDKTISNSEYDVNQLTEYKNLYIKTQMELEQQLKMNEQLKKDLSKAQTLIGKLFMEINHPK